ncbi:MAG: para-nitrobenzyl esterase, partial [Acidimicrobiaceae bacterium]|nr:para-nitrobenzyl esterase [Acidimicrobiaceae bacterium]
IPFVFGNLDRAGMDVFAGSGPEADRLSLQMQGAWLAFARTGNPSTPDLPDWPPYDTDRRATMVFDRDSRVEDAPMEAERAFWEGKV